jgi:tetratricopeptide (TPR) repeat protein
MIYAWNARATDKVIEEKLARGLAAVEAKRADEALSICEGLLEQIPGLPQALALKSRIRAEADDAENAILLLEHAIAGDPNVPIWHAKLAGLYQDVGRYADAVRSMRRAVRLEPRNAQLLISLALALIDIEEHDRATVCLLRAIGQSPDSALAHLGLAQVLLSRGEMGAGWIEYEWRNKLDTTTNKLPRITSLAWNGMHLPGRLLVISDQGFGDTIQFARFLPLAAERCQELVLACSEPLLPILSTIAGVSSCQTRWHEIPLHAAHIRISSLAYALQVRSEQEIPAPGGYLKAPTERVAAWKKRFASLPRGPRIGFVWKGRPEHPNDRRRSLQLATLRPLLQQTGFRWISMQKLVSKEEAAELTQYGVLDVSDSLTDLGETAAAIANLDLVITVDTGVAHVAGALGRPVWVMLPTPADWRWLLKRADSPWYASMRLFRQDQPGAWDKVVTDVSAALRDWRGAKRPMRGKPRARKRA